MLLKFSSLCFVYILKDLFKNLYVVYFVKIKTPFPWNSLYSFLLYKPLPTKVILLSLILNDFQLFSEGKLYSSTSLNSKYCIAYRNNIVSRRNIWAYPGTRRGILWSSGQHCGINWSPEFLFGRTSTYWLYRHRYRQAPVHNPIILNYATYSYFLLVHLSYWSWLKTLDA